MMHVRHYAAPRPVVVERQRIEGRLRPSARDLFPMLRERLLASRPIVGDMRPIKGADGVNTPLRPVYGAPRFRNRLDENGRLV